MDSQTKFMSRNIVAYEMNEKNEVHNYHKNVDKWKVPSHDKTAIKAPLVVKPILH